MIRYAGYDPEEDNFEGIELAPLHPVDAARRRNRGHKPREIDVRLAMDLRAQGLTWMEIGARLAKEKLRKTPFHGSSICQAVSRQMKINKEIEDAMFRTRN